MEKGRSSGMSLAQETLRQDLISNVIKKFVKNVKKK